MLLKVTQEHIDRGRRGSPSFCPVAEAVRWYGIAWPHINQESIRGVRQGLSVDIPTTSRLATWIRRFDAGLPVSPATFRIKGL